MKIVHVVTMITEDGRFGGPALVAQEIAREQALRGHSVTLIAGSDENQVTTPPGRAPRMILRRVVNLLPSMGYAALLSPRLLLDLLFELRRADIAHVHLSRDLITIAALLVARLSRTPAIAQTHGMMDRARGLLPRLVDCLLMKPALVNVKLAATLTDEEGDALRDLTRGSIECRYIPNSVPEGWLPDEGAKRDIVLFLARLHPRKGAEQFARVALSLREQFPDFEFVIAGPDEGSRKNIDELISNSIHKLRVLGAQRRFEVQDLMSRSALYVLPAAKEPFGLTLLEAMACECPVVLHETASLASQVIANEAGLTFDGTDEDLKRILSQLLSNESLRIEMAGNGRAFVERNFTVDSIVDQVEDIYERADIFTKRDV